jgi:hypothetical protein
MVTHLTMIIVGTTGVLAYYVLLLITNMFYDILLAIDIPLLIIVK